MRDVRFIFSVILLLIAAVEGFGQRAPTSVAGELLVKFARGTSVVKANSVHRALGSEVVEELGDLGWERVKLPAGLSIGRAISRYKDLEGVESVQPNYYYHLLTTPNDPSFNLSGMYGLSKISAPIAWDLTTGSSAVVVADIDTGMLYTHQDLAANAWVNPGEIPNNGVDDDGNGFVDDVYGWDFFYNDSDPVDDAGGHGTHTAGTIGAVGNNGIGVVGVNWNVKIMSIKVYSPNGTDSTSAMLVNAYNYIRMMKLRGVNIRATNNSYGGCNEACGYDQATKDGIDAMGEVGIVNVFAAGNSNTNNDVTPFFPVNYTSPSIIGVAASDATDSKASFSSYGLTNVDLAAPGVGVLSTVNSSNTSYGTKSGTSMATPHVTGAVALLSAYNPDLSAASLKATILNNVDLLANWTTLVKTGGRLNVNKSLLNPTVCTFVTPTTSLTVPTKGGVFNVNVTSPTNCDYMVKSPVRWVKVMSADTLSGSGTITFRVTVNPTITRSAVISIGGQNYTISQSRN